MLKNVLIIFIYLRLDKLGPTDLESNSDRLKSVVLSAGLSVDSLEHISNTWDTFVSPE